MSHHLISSLNINITWNRLQFVAAARVRVPIAIEPLLLTKSLIITLGGPCLLSSIVLHKRIPVIVTTSNFVILSASFIGFQIIFSRKIGQQLVCLLKIISKWNTIGHTIELAVSSD